MSLARTIAANTAVQIAGKVVSTILGVVAVGMMTRLLGTGGFGAYSTANSFVQVFAIILDMGLNIMIVQMLGERAGDKAFEDRAVSAIYSLRFWSALVLLSLAPIIALLTPYSWEIKTAIFAIWGSFFFTMLNQIVIGVQQRHLKMHVVAISEVVGRIVLLAGVFIAMKNGWGVVPVTIFVSIAGMFNFFINFLIARHYASFKIGFDIEFWKIVLKRSWPIGVSVLFVLIYFKSDTLILSWFFPMEEVGIYSAAYRVLEILITFPFMYAGVLLPIMANAWAKKDKDRFAHLTQRSFDAFALLTFPMVAGILLVADKAMVLVGGNEFLASGNVLRILALAVGAIYLGTMFTHAVVALNLQHYILKFYGIVAVVTFILYILFIPQYGLWAAAWLTVFSEVTLSLICAIVTVKKSDMKLSLSVTGKALFVSIVMYFFALPFAENSLIAPIGIGVLVYSVGVFATKAVTKEMVTEILFPKKTMPEVQDHV